MQIKLFEIEEQKPCKTCKTCEHRVRTKYLFGNKYMQYCTKRFSDKNQFGLLRIKLKTKACNLYEQKTK